MYIYVINYLQTVDILISKTQTTEFQSNIQRKTW